MTKIHALPSRYDADGAARLAAALEDDILSGRDLGPRGVQVQALAMSLEQVNRELLREIESWPDSADGDPPAARAVCETMVQLRAYLPLFSGALAQFTVLAQARLG